MWIGLFLSLKTEVHLICTALSDSMLGNFELGSFFLVLFCCLNVLKRIHGEYFNANQPYAVNVNLKVNYN